MNAADLRTAEQLREIVRSAAPSITAPPDVAQRVLASMGAEPRRRRKQLILALGVITLAGAVAAAGFTNRGDYRRWRQPSGAMSPTIGVGQTVLVGKELAPQRGDVILLTADNGAESFEMLSRVIGLPGDTVACPAEPDGTCKAVLVSGAPLSEPWLHATTGPFPSTSVPPGAVFVLGDARDQAVDSRMIGSQRLDAVMGVVVAKFNAQGEREAIEGTPKRDLPGDEEFGDPADPVPPARSS